MRKFHHKFWRNFNHNANCSSDWRNKDATKTYVSSKTDTCNFVLPYFNNFSFYHFIATHTFLADLSTNFILNLNVKKSQLMPRLF